MSMRGIKSALSGLIVRIGAAKLARRLEKDRKTIARDRGDDLQKWRAFELLELAKVDPALRQAMIEFLQAARAERQGTADHLRVAHESMEFSFVLLSRLTEALKDRRIDPREARALLPEVDRVVDHLRDVLRPMLVDIADVAAPNRV